MKPVAQQPLLSGAREAEAGGQGVSVDPLEFDPSDAASVLGVIERVRSLAISDLPMAMAVSADLMDRVGADSPARPRVLSLRAVALSYRSDFAGALGALDEAEALLGARGERGGPEDGNLQLAKVQPLARLGRLAEAEGAASAACACLSGTALEGKARVNLGIVLRMRGRASEALSAFDAAAPRLGGDAGACAALESNRAEALLDLDRLGDAAEAVECAFEAFRRAGMEHGAAIAEGNLADILARRGLIDQAIERFEAARERFERSGAGADAARLTGEQAEALRLAGAPRKAARLYVEAIDRLSACGLARELSRARLGLGLIRAQQGNLASGLMLLRAAAAGARTCGDRALAAECDLATAEAQSAAGRHAEAEAGAASALGALGDRPLRAALARCVLADAALARGEAGAALRIAGEVAEAAGALGVTPLRVRALQVRAGALEAGDDLAGARGAYEEAMRLTELFRGSLRAEQVRTACLESSGDLYVRACANRLALGDRGAAAGVFAIIERVRARTLMEAIRRGPAGEVGGPERGERCADLLAELDGLYRRLDGAGRPVPVEGAGDGGPASLSERTRRVEAMLERELDLLRTDAPAGARAWSAPLTLDEAVARVSPGVTIASYFRDDGAISALVIGRGGARVVRGLVTAARAGGLARRIWLEAESACAGRIGRERSDAAALRETAALLLDPLLEEGERGGRLAVSLCRELHALPMCAAAAFARREVSCCLTPSVSAALLERAGSPAGRGVLVAAVPDDLAPDMEREGLAVAAALGGARVLMGEGATAGVVLGELRGAGVAHLACHALYDDEFPMSSRLRLADRWVTARELVGSLAPGSLVVLSGCDTGRSPSWTGEDRYGLVRAMLVSGASAVVSSLWRLHDQTAAAAFGGFHAALERSGARPGFAAAEALSGTIRKLIQDQIPWPAWAGLTVKGVAL